MSPRPYRLGKRAADIEETRERIVSAATELFGQSGFHAVTLDDVAKRAGVARATVYYQFESKSGLLNAAIAAMVERIGSERARRAREHADPATGVRLYVKEVVAFLSREDALLRNIYGLAAVDPEVGRVVDEWEQRRKDVLAWLVKRLADQGKLRSDISQKQAVDVLWMLTSFASFDQMRSRSGRSVRASAAALSDMAALAVLAPARNG
jgi:AcrR family transcriptional regulator